MSLKGLRDQGPRDINARWPVWGTSRSGALMARRIPVVLILVLVTTTLSGRTVDPPWSSNALPFSYDDWSSQDWGLWRRGRGYGYRPLTEELALSVVARFREWRKKH